MNDALVGWDALNGESTAYRRVSEWESFRCFIGTCMPESGASAAISAGGAKLHIAGDPDDTHRVNASFTAPNSEAVATTYLLRPDSAAWQISDEEREQLVGEWSGIPGWRAHSFDVVIDVSPKTITVWVDGRFIGECANDSASNDVDLSVEGGATVESADLVQLTNPGSFVITDLRNLAGDESSSLPQIGAEDTPFQVEQDVETAPTIDVCKTQYRGIAPYLECSALSSDPGRLLIRVPKDYFDQVHLLCRYNGDPEMVSTAAVRVLAEGRSRPITSDFSAPSGEMQHVVVPIDAGLIQDWMADDSITALEIDFTRVVALDELRFPRPVGPQSGVQIAAVTLERSPVVMSVTSDEIGHIFETPDTPRFDLNLTNQLDRATTVHINATVSGSDGTTIHDLPPVTLNASEQQSVTLDLPQKSFGKHDLTVRCESENGRIIERRTSFATIPPDERFDTTESPFGMWCFFEGHHGAPAEVAGPLLRKAGVKWTLANFIITGTPEQTEHKLNVLAEHGVQIGCANVACIANTCNDGCADIEAMIERMRGMPEAPYWLVFWETSLGREHADHFPRELVGESPRKLTDDERIILDNCRRTGIEYAQRVREEFPDATLVYGNGYVNFIAALLNDGYPLDLIDGFGLDFNMFLGMPEQQPGPMHAPFGGLYHLQKVQELHGCADRPRFLTEAVYLAQDDGWLTEREQADYYVRSHLIGLAAGVVHFGMTAEMWDPIGWYRYGHYGPVGLCHEPPEVNPRESYCAYATMTRMLDSKRFAGYVDAESPSVFALRFDHINGSDSTIAIWTIRGTRSVIIRSDAPLTATDLYGNTQEIIPDDGHIMLEIGHTPQYVCGSTELTDLALGEPVHEIVAGSAVLVDATVMSTWERLDSHDEILDGFTDGPHGPVKARYVPGSFEYISPDRDGALSITLIERQDSHELDVNYSQLKPATPIPISENTQHLTATIRGNSSWGRIVYEMTDANGETWRSMIQDEYIDFDGWKTLVTPLPIETEADIDPRGYTSWKSMTEHAVPTPPFSLTGIIVEARSHVIRGVDIIPVPDPTFLLRDISTI
jgi:hypothetical protein